MREGVEDVGRDGRRVRVRGNVARARVGRADRGLVAGLAGAVAVLETLGLVEGLVASGVHECEVGGVEGVRVDVELGEVDVELGVDLVGGVVETGRRVRVVVEGL